MCFLPFFLQPTCRLPLLLQQEPLTFCSHSHWASPTLCRLRGCTSFVMCSVPRLLSSILPRSCFIILHAALRSSRLSHRHLLPPSPLLIGLVVSLIFILLPFSRRPSQTPSCYRASRVPPPPNRYHPSLCCTLRLLVFVRRAFAVSLPETHFPSHFPEEERAFECRKI